MKELIEKNAGDPARLGKILEAVGMTIGTFHMVNLDVIDNKFYSRNHGDLHLNNIVYKSNGDDSIITFIDLETMAKSLESSTEIGSDLNKLLAYLFHRWKPEIYKPGVTENTLSTVCKHLISGYLNAFELSIRSKIVNYMQTYFKPGMSKKNFTADFGPLFSILTHPDFASQNFNKAIGEIEQQYEKSLTIEEDQAFIHSIGNVCRQYTDICKEEFMAACERRGFSAEEFEEVYKEHGYEQHIRPLTIQ